MANPELDQAEAHARVEAFERIGARLLEMEREAGHFGIPDCIDNAGRHYQSKAFESLISEVRALLSGSTPKPAGVDPSERDVLRLAGLLLLYAINSEDASAITVAETGLRSAIRPAVSWSELWSVLADGAPKSTVDEALTAALSGPSE